MNFAFGQRYVVVNIPATFAEAVENDKVVRRYRVIVGKTEKPSPTLTAEITGVVLNPTWTVPSSIAKTEISAHMRKDPGYLSRMHMEVLDAHDNPIDPHRSTGPARIRRTSPCGSRTAPSMRWARSRSTCPIPIRSTCTTPTSATCSATTIASILTAARGSTMCATSRPGCCRKRCRNGIATPIDAAIATGAHQEVALPKKVPVAWIYLTAWMTKDQTVQFRNDVYAQDEQLLEATAEEAAFFNQAANHPLTAHLAR